MHRTAQPSPAGMRGLRRFGALVLLTAAACTPRQMLVQAGVPGSFTRAELSAVRERSDYLDAVVEMAGYRYRFFFPNSPECRETLVEGASVEYAHYGLLGRVRNQEHRCEPNGVLSLEAWRDRGPRRSRQPLPRVQATFEVFYRDEELALARGRFPLASEIRWAGGWDTVGVIPNVADCQAVLEAGVASMEFRAGGSPAFALVGKSRPCPMLGFARPVARSVPSSAPD